MKLGVVFAIYTQGHFKLKQLYIRLNGRWLENVGRKLRQEAFCRTRAFGQKHCEAFRQVNQIFEFIHDDSDDAGKAGVSCKVTLPSPTIRKKLHYLKCRFESITSRINKAIDRQ